MNKENFRVVITPYLSEHDIAQGVTAEQRCERIVKRIVRGDFVSTVKTIEVIHDEAIPPAGAASASKSESMMDYYL